MTLTITDLFCGAGGSGLGARDAGFDLVIAANHWQRAIETHALNFPDTEHDCADISQIDPRRYPTTDVLWASPECFTAGHFVTTTRGQVPIEDVVVGDVALTHLGRWRRVVRVQNKKGSTVVVRGQGEHGIEVTPNHKFWLRSARGVKEPEWLAIADAVDLELLWATPSGFELHAGAFGIHTASFQKDGLAWSHVRSITPGRENVAVYNIEVEEDHSYVLDGIVVANCTNHSQARGLSRSSQSQPDLFGETLPSEAAERSRATMWDVPRFAEWHHYRAIVVENVTEATKWVMFPAWLQAMELLGYDHEIVSLNSMHAPATKAPRAPQSRDRIYVVFWRKGQRRPDVAPKIPAWCEACGKDVTAHQAWKNGRTVGRYRQQYLYVCSQGHIVEPYVLPAAAAIDWSMKGTRIGDRAKPLSDKTRARIGAGINKFWRPMTFEATGNTFVRTGPDGVPTYARAWPVDQPTATLTASETRALVVPYRSKSNAKSTDEPMPTLTCVDPAALVVPVEGREGKKAQPASVPARTMTTRSETALVVPLRTHGTTDSADGPFKTFVAGNVGQALVEPGDPHAFVAELRGGGSKARSIRDPLATVTASGNHHMLVRHNGDGDGQPGWQCTLTSEPMRTLVAITNQSLVSIEQEIDDATFRMLEPHEIQAAMAFAADYQITGNRREKVRQLGNGVTPPAAEFLLRAVAKSLDAA